MAFELPMIWFLIILITLLILSPNRFQVVQFLIPKQRLTIVTPHSDRILRIGRLAL